MSGALLIDDFRRDDLVSALGTTWRGVSDRVMGGVSRACVQLDEHAGRRCLRLSGDVRLENNGGFVQAGLDLACGNETLDASAYAGLSILVCGNGERYSLHLRTADVVRPWQSYRAHFHAPPGWCERRIPFTAFEAHRIAAPLDLTRLRRIGVVAIGRAFQADVRVAAMRLYAAADPGARALAGCGDPSAPGPRA